MKKLLSVLVGIVLLMSTAAAPRVEALAFTLTHNNNTLQYNDTGGFNFINWSVDGMNHLFEETGVHRVGAGGPVFLGGGLLLFNVGNVAGVQYSIPGWTLTVIHSLLGAGEGLGQWSSSWAMSPNADAQALNFYNYTDYDLLNTPGGDTAQFFAGGGGTRSFRQSDSDASLSWGITSGMLPFFWAIRDFPQLLGMFGANLPNNCVNGGPVGPCTLGPTDATFAAQLFFGTGAGSFSIDRSMTVQQVIPEPASLLLLGTGLAGAAISLRRFRAKKQK